MNVARCIDCFARATNQALYRKANGAHFLGAPTCDEHRKPLGVPPFAVFTEAVGYVETEAPKSPEQILERAEPSTRAQV